MPTPNHAPPPHTAYTFKTALLNTVGISRYPSSPSIILLHDDYVRLKKLVRMLKVLALTHKSKLLLGGRFAANIRRRNFANKPTFTQLLNEKHFNHKEVESLTYAWWDASGYFKPNDKAECFVVPMPPPNVTGNLHMGHAMFVSLQDIMVRFNRMRGKSTLWMPGT